MLLSVHFLSPALRSRAGQRLTWIRVVRQLQTVWHVRPLSAAGEQDIPKYWTLLFQLLGYQWLKLNDQNVFLFFSPLPFTMTKMYVLWSNTVVLKEVVLCYLTSIGVIFFCFWEAKRSLEKVWSLHHIKPQRHRSRTFWNGLFVSSCTLMTLHCKLFA